MIETVHLAMSTSSVSIVREEREGYRYLVARPSTTLHAPPMVFVHGIFGFGAYFTDLMSYFAARGFICYAPDIMGHGERRDIDLAHKGVRDYIADMSGFLDHVVVGAHNAPTILVGHSMGGVIVAKLAEESRVGHLILITPAPPRGVRFLPGGFVRITLSDVVEAIRMAMRGKLFLPSRTALASFFVDPIASKSAIDMFMADIVMEPLSVPLTLACSKIPVDARKITAPILVVGAKYDKMIHPSVAQNIATYFHADLQVLPTLGHMCPFEAGWEGTATAMYSWLMAHKA